MDHPITTPYACRVRAVTEEVTERARNLFAKALQEAVTKSGLSQEQVCERTDGLVNQPKLSSWMSGKYAPKSPAAVFALERALGWPPGALSGYLGYLPNEVYRVSIEAAIAVDDRIDQATRETLMDALDRYRRRSDAGS